MKDFNSVYGEKVQSIREEKVQSFARKWSAITCFWAYSSLFAAPTLCFTSLGAASAITTASAMPLYQGMLLGVFTGVRILAAAALPAIPITIIMAGVVYYVVYKNAVESLTVQKVDVSNLGTENGMVIDLDLSTDEIKSLFIKSLRKVSVPSSVMH